jgi:ABC-type transport system involved in multi-copper enzyme maturation permease subunit
MKINNLFRELKIVLLVSRDVCRAAIKERMMYGFLLLAFLFILMANVPFVIDDPKVFSGQTPAVSALQIGFMTINIFTILIAIFVSVNTLQVFLSKESLVLLLSKPVRRWQIFQGVVLGLFEMVFLNWFLMTMSLWCVIVSQTRVLALPIWSGMSVTVLMALLYVSLVVFFYTLIPNAVAGVLTILLVIAGFGVPLARETFGRMTQTGWVGSFLEFGLNVLPQINGLWGASMKTLDLFALQINTAPIYWQTLASIVILNAVSAYKFRKLCKF